MLCPRCHDAFLDERERDGVVVDVCRKCRGMWLDRGELEKLRGEVRFGDEQHPRHRKRRGLVDLLDELID